jgi:ThiF family/Prokaryotic E2 family C
MALAPYHRRAAVAAAQILEGFDEQRFADALSAPIGLSFGPDSTSTAEGGALLDLTTRILARLYPIIELRASEHAEAERQRLEESARRINPDIEFAEAKLGIVVGRDSNSFAESVYAGSDGWDALVSTESPQSIGRTTNVLGAGASACLASANLFRWALLPPESRGLDTSVRYSTFRLDRIDAEDRVPPLPPVELNKAVVVGCGAIGNGTIWALGRADVSGELHLVDPETIELSNLQRYVLATIDDVERPKVNVAAEALVESLATSSHEMSFAEFVARYGTAFDSIAVSVDNRRDRIAVQSSLPKTTFNAWTQPGDLGVSVHPDFAGSGACISCLYTPDTPRPNDDELVAQALGIPERSREVRTLLATGAPPSSELLDSIAAGLGVPVESVQAYANQPIHLLYSEGVCGGAVLPVASAAHPSRDMHVPLAHQSALAGVLLAAGLLRHAAGLGPDETHVSRIDIQRAVGVELAQPFARIGERCFCGDADYVAAYRRKWGTEV